MCFLRIMSKVRLLANVHVHYSIRKTEFKNQIEGFCGRKFANLYNL